MIDVKNKNRYELIACYSDDERLPGYCRDQDNIIIWDNLLNSVIAEDGGEPEDQTFYRDLSWIVPILNKQDNQIQKANIIIAAAREVIAYDWGMIEGGEKDADAFNAIGELEDSLSDLDE